MSWIVIVLIALGYLLIAGVVASLAATGQELDVDCFLVGLLWPVWVPLSIVKFIIKYLFW